MMPTTTETQDDLEWEEWDGTSPFWHHCIAGSMAGVTEHTLLYPIDTVKTHLQCAACPHQQGRSTTLHKAGTKIMHGSHYYWRKPQANGIMSTMRHLMSQAIVEQSHPTMGATRLWRGVQTMVLGCIPAHALYFSCYEAVKFHVEQQQQGHDQHALEYNLGMATAGAAATIGHDVVMTPLDTIKQRLQLGHYSGMIHASKHIFHAEGTMGLFRSFPITLVTNIPYGMVMVSTNEFLKHHLTKHGKQLDLQTCLVSSSVAGLLAAATTTPLDRIKTFLQTQQLQPACDLGACPKLSGPPLHVGQAVQIIFKREGLRGFFRGMFPRIVTHTPAVAISWTTYETAKQWLFVASM